LGAGLWGGGDGEEENRRQEELRPLWMIHIRFARCHYVLRASSEIWDGISGVLLWERKGAP
jgi:hypothetical protein